MGIIETAALVASVYGTLEQRKSAARAEDRAREAQSASQERFRVEQQRADVQNIRSARESIRRARMAQASMANIGAQTGGMGGSALAGGTASIGSQTTSNLNYMDQIAALNTQIGQAGADYSTAMSEASIEQMRGQTAGAIASSGYSVFQSVGGVASLKDAYKNMLDN